MRRLLLASLLVVACQGTMPPTGPGTDPGDPPPDPTTDPDQFEFLSPTDHLVRASMVLRGVRPSIDDLEMVKADPAALETLVDDYLDAPEFGVTMRDLHAEAFLTRDFGLPAVDSLATTATGKIAGSIGDEQLRLIEHVITENRPYTEIVTADYTMADKTVARAYGLAYDDAGPTWQETHYTDGRQHAGVISSETFYLRHRSAGANYHRGRANMLSKALLCYDFLDRDVVIDGSVDLSDPDVVSDAVRQNPACASCHQTLDPLASFLWGFDPNLNTNNIATYPIMNYFKPANVERWRNTTGRPPGYFGLAGTTLADLGDLIAADPRFSLCAAKRFYGYFTETPLPEVPLEEAARLQQVFIDSGYDAKTLAKAVVLSDAFRVAYGNTDAAAEVAHGYLKLRPEQMDRMIRDLTGFSWETDITFNYKKGQLGLVNLATSSVLGFVALGGGIDSNFVVQPSFGYNVTSSLVLRQMAEETAGYVVEADFAQADPAMRKLLTMVEAGDSDEAGVRAQLAELHERFYAELADPGSEAVSETWALWKAVFDRTGDVRHAWKTTLTAMLQDQRIAFY